MSRCSDCGEEEGRTWNDDLCIQCYIKRRAAKNEFLLGKSITSFNTDCLGRLKSIVLNDVILEADLDHEGDALLKIIKEKTK